MEKTLIKKIKAIDWEFIEDDTRYGTHDFHRYSSKFIPQIAKNLIEIFSKPGELILDVFLGSGTTCVEAELSGRKSIGIDLNPLSYLISKVKTTPIKDKYLSRKINDYLIKIRKKITIAREKKKIASNIPVFPYIEKWFQSQVLNELCVIKDEINKIKDKNIKLFFVCGFSAILRGVSNAHSGYGNLMINKEKRQIKNTFENFERQILNMSEGMKEFNEKVSSSLAKIFWADARKIPFIKNNSVDLIVTHPPYISAVPYAEYQKLSLNWLKECFASVFKDSCVSYLSPRILDKEMIGGQRSKTNVIERFRDSMELVFKEMYRVTKRGGFCCIIIGHPTVRGKKIELSDDFINVAKKNGFFHFYTIQRNNHRTTMGKMKKEFILIFRK